MTCNNLVSFLFSHKSAEGQALMLDEEVWGPVNVPDDQFRVEAIGHRVGSLRCSRTSWTAARRYGGVLVSTVASHQKNSCGLSVWSLHVHPVYDVGSPWVLRFPPTASMLG